MGKVKNFLIGLFLAVCALGCLHAHTAVACNQEPSQCVTDTYLGEVGVSQDPGCNNCGERVEQYLAAVGLGPGYAWCAAFVAWVFDQCDVSYTGNAWTPSWFPNSKTVYDRSQRGNSHDVIQRADVFGIYFARLGRIAHVGFVYDRQGDYLVTVEGNTNDTGSRMGDSVHKKRRHLNQIAKASRWI